MNAKETKIQPFIEGTKQFVVPLFQRPYSWERKHWNTLWDDLIELYEEEQPKNHFIGSVVTMPAVSVPEGVTKYVLIDGQQRITTTLILLALIRDHARTLPSTLSDQIENLLLLNPYQDGNDKYKMLPTQVDRDAFTKIVRGDFVAEENQITKAYRFFDKQLRTAEGINLEKLLGIIVRNLVLVSIVLDAGDNPHLIFESLNAKGRALTQADLIRNFFFMRIQADQQELAYEKNWAPLQSRLGEALTECIRHFLMKDGAVVKQGEVFFTLKERAEDKSQQEIICYLEELTVFAGYYDRFLHPERESNLILRRKMENLNRIEVTTAYPFLLNIYHEVDQNSISAHDAGEILDILENFMIRRFVCGVPTNTLNKMFPLLYSQAKLHDKLVAGIKTILASKNYPQDDEFREKFIASRFYGGDRGVKGRLILEKLEESYGHKETIQGGSISIEHVMPQTLTEWWKAHLGPNWEAYHEHWLDTIGNLTLTGYNPQLSNADFAAKQEVYIKSHFELNRSFAAYSRWDHVSIEARAEQLALRALQVWNNLSPGQTDLEDVSSLDPDSEIQYEGFDLSFVLDGLKAASLDVTDLRLALYESQVGEIFTVKYSKLYARRNHYWYGLRPNTIEELNDAKATHIAFVMGRYGVAMISMKLLDAYFRHTKVSHNPNGTIRHYHLLISNEMNPHLFWSLDTPRYPLSECFVRFKT